MYRDFPKRFPTHLQPVMSRFLATYVMPYTFTEDKFYPSNEFIYPDLIENDSEEETHDLVSENGSEGEDNRSHYFLTKE